MDNLGISTADADKDVDKADLLDTGIDKANLDANGVNNSNICKANANAEAYIRITQA